MAKHRLPRVRHRRLNTAAKAVTGLAMTSALATGLASPSAAAAEPLPPCTKVVDNKWTTADGRNTPVADNGSSRCVAGPGSQGPAVREVQASCNGYAARRDQVRQDGVYGAKTKECVRGQQERTGVKDKDGVWGPDTLKGRNENPPPPRGNATMRSETLERKGSR